MMKPTPDGSRGLQKPRHQRRGREGDRWGSLAPMGPTCQPRCYVDLSPPLRMYLSCCLSRFDPGAHVGPSGLYNPAPASPPGITLVIKLFEKTETLIILRPPTYFRA